MAAMFSTARRVESSFNKLKQVTFTKKCWIHLLDAPTNKNRGRDGSHDQGFCLGRPFGILPEKKWNVRKNHVQIW
jgi:hypothetical protein